MGAVGAVGGAVPGWAQGGEAGSVARSKGEGLRAGLKQGMWGTQSAHGQPDPASGAGTSAVWCLPSPLRTSAQACLVPAVADAVDVAGEGGNGLKGGLGREGCGAGQPAEQCRTHTAALITLCCFGGCRNVALCILLPKVRPPLAAALPSPSWKVRR